MALPKNFDVSTAPTHKMAESFKYAVSCLTDRRIKYIKSIKNKMDQYNSNDADGFTRNEINNMLFVIFHVFENTGFINTLPPREQNEFVLLVNKISARTLRVGNVK